MHWHSCLATTLSLTGNVHSLIERSLILQCVVNVVVLNFIHVAILSFPFIVDVITTQAIATYRYRV